MSEYSGIGTTKDAWWKDRKEGLGKVVRDQIVLGLLKTRKRGGNFFFLPVEGKKKKKKKLCFEEKQDLSCSVLSDDFPQNKLQILYRH